MHPRTRPWKFALLITSSIVALCLFAFYRGLPTTRIALQGTAGLPFTGAINADGRILNINGHLPAEFTIPGRKVNCSFSKTEPTGRLVLRIYSGETSFQETYTDKSKGGVRGEIIISQAAFGSSKYSKREGKLSIFEN